MYTNMFACFDDSMYTNLVCMSTYMCTLYFLWYMNLLLLMVIFEQPASRIFVYFAIDV